MDIRAMHRLCVYCAPSSKTNTDNFTKQVNCSRTDKRLTDMVFSAKTRSLLVGGVFLAVVAMAQRAQSQEIALQPAGTQGELIFRPYVWMAFFNGTSTLGSNRTNIDTNLFEVVGKADELYGFMGYGEYRKDKFSVWSDLVWAKINVGTSVVKSANPIAGLNASLVANANVWFDMAVLETSAAYEVAKWTRGGGGSLKDGYAFAPTTSLDLTAGFRYWYLKPNVGLGVTAAIDIPALGLSRSTAGDVSASTTIDWFDPLIGFRLRQKSAPGQELEIRGDIGGFGAGSNFTWQGIVGYSMQTQFLGYTWNNYIGYRALHIDYEQGTGPRRFGLDLLEHGPVLGLNLKW